MASEEAQGSRATRRLTTKEVVPLKSVDEVLQRFNLMRSWHKDHGKFNPDTFTREAAAHIEAHKISELGDAQSSETQNATIVVENVATFKDVSFFHDPVSGAIHSVCNEGMKNAMIHRGFEEVFVQHHTSLDSLPSSCSTRNRPVSDADLHSAAAPATLTLPDGRVSKGKIPALWRHSDDETWAVSIVRAFETKVVDPNTKVIYSPYRLWTDAARQQFRLSDSKFTKRCQAYVAVRDGNIDKNPADITTGFNNLVLEASKLLKERNIVKPKWFDMACAIANERKWENRNLQ